MASRGFNEIELLQIKIFFCFYLFLPREIPFPTHHHHPSNKQTNTINITTSIKHKLILNTHTHTVTHSLTVYSRENKK